MHWNWIQSVYGLLCISLTYNPISDNRGSQTVNLDVRLYCLQYWWMGMHCIMQSSAKWIFCHMRPSNVLHARDRKYTVQYSQAFNCGRENLKPQPVGRKVMFRNSSHRSSDEICLQICKIFITVRLTEVCYLKMWLIMSKSLWITGIM